MFYVYVFTTVWKSCSLDVMIVVVVVVVSLYSHVFAGGAEPVRKGKKVNKN